MNHRLSHATLSYLGAVRFLGKSWGREQWKREKSVGTRVQGRHGRGGHVSLSRYVCIVVHRVETSISLLYAPLTKTFFLYPSALPLPLFESRRILSVRPLIIKLILFRYQKIHLFNGQLYRFR